jgi:hypothetical protein
MQGRKVWGTSWVEEASSRPIPQQFLQEPGYYNTGLLHILVGYRYYQVRTGTTYSRGFLRTGTFSNHASKRTGTPLKCHDVCWMTWQKASLKIRCDVAKGLVENKMLEQMP